MKVLGIGNALVDVLAILKSEDSIKEMGLLKGAMELIDEDKLIKLMDFITVFETKQASGGSSANTIAGITRMGIKGGFIGKVGNDSFGHFYRQDLLHNRVEPLLLESDIPSGCAMCMITPDGERTMNTYLGAAASMTTKDISADLFDGYDLLHIEGYLVNDPEFIRHACKLAKAAGLKISLDLASFNIVEYNLDLFKELITQYTDIVFANEDEAYAYTGENPEKACEILSKQCAIAIVKKGAKGSIIRRGDEVVSVGIHKADCIDTTGAGDLYAAGFIYGMSKNLSLDKCGRIGAVLSGNVVEVVGPKMNDTRWNKIKLKVEDIIAE